MHTCYMCVCMFTIHSYIYYDIQTKKRISVTIQSCNCQNCEGIILIILNFTYICNFSLKIKIYNNNNIIIIIIIASTLNASAITAFAL